MPTKRCSEKADAAEKAGDVAYRVEACMALGGAFLAAIYFGLLCIAAGGAVDHLLNSIHGYVSTYAIYPSNLYLI